MRNFLYASRQVFKLKGNNLIKILSLTLGLVMGGTFAARVGFERSWDSFIPDVDQLYKLELYGTVGSQDVSSKQTMGPMAPGIVEAIPDVVGGTRFMKLREQNYMDGDKFYRMQTYNVDSCFFDVLDFGVISGNTQDLAIENNAFISQEYAQMIFGDRDPIGEILIQNEKTITIKGVFNTIPTNCHLNFDIVVALESFLTRWDSGDLYHTYLKLRNGAAPDIVNQDISELIDSKVDSQQMSANGIDFKYRLEPVRTISTKHFTEIDIIMSILALILVLVGSLNYVLLTLSSLSSRAKEVGVHKASGASRAGIFSLVMWETFIYVVLALTLSVILMLSFRPQLEDLAGKYSDIFSLSNLWSLLIVVLFIFAVAGAIPAWLFAKIPVTQIFRRYTDNKMNWKRALLFFQFLSASFIVSFLIVIVMQYNQIRFGNMGYNYENVAYTTLSLESKEQCMLAANEIERLPFVKKVSLTNSLPLYGANNGFSIMDVNGQEVKVNCGQIQIDHRFFDLMEIPIVQGRNIYSESDSTIVLVDKILEARMTALDLETYSYSFNYRDRIHTIGGIVPDIKIGSFHSESHPIIYTRFEDEMWSKKINLLMKFDEMSPENLKTVYTRLRELFPKRDFSVQSYDTSIKYAYSAEQMFRDGVLVASLVLITITIMGIIGYIATETRRRSREVAVRKVHGATSGSVIWLFMRGIGFLCLIASIVGVTASYVIAGYWQQGFTIKSELSWWIFALSAMFVIAIVVVSVVIQTWKIATSNPARSIKSE